MINHHGHCQGRGVVVVLFKGPDGRRPHRPYFNMIGRLTGGLPQVIHQSPGSRTSGRVATGHRPVQSSSARTSGGSQESLSEQRSITITNPGTDAGGGGGRGGGTYPNFAAMSYTCFSCCRTFSRFPSNSSVATHRRFWSKPLNCGRRAEGSGVKGGSTAGLLLFSSLPS